MPKGQASRFATDQAKSKISVGRPRALISSEWGLAPRRKKTLPCRFRARKSKGFQRNLRKRGAEGNLSPPPPGELERAAALSTSNQNDFRRKIVSFSYRGWQWRGSLLPRSHPSVTALAMSAIAAANMLSVFPGLAHAAENRDNDADQYSADDYSAHFQPLTFCLFS